MKPKCCAKNVTARGIALAAESFKVLAEPNRLKILCMLQEGERCVCDIWRFLKLPQNLISHHLKILKDAGLISSRKDGLRVYYSMDRSAVSKFNSSLKSFFETYEG